MPFRTGFGIIKPPLEIAGIDFWLDFTDINKLTLNGTDVSAAQDISGRNKDFLMATALDQPQYIINAHNGLNAARFNGTNEFMEGLTDVLNTDESTMIALVKLDPTGLNEATLFSKYGIFNQQLLILRSDNDGFQSLWYVRDNASNTLILNPTVPTTYCVMVATRKPGEIVTHVNSSILTNTGTYFATSYGGGSRKATLGAQINFATQIPFGGTFLKGEVMHIGNYNRVLLPSEIAYLKTYLSNIGGVAL